MENSNMSELAQPSRRSLLKAIAGAPLLPLGVGSILYSNQVAAKSNAKYVSSYFTSMAAPTLANPAQMAAVTVGSTFNVKLSDGSTQSYKLEHRAFFTTGDMVADGKGGKVLAGGYVDINNKPIMDTSVVGKERQVFSDAPDGTSLVSLGDVKVAGVTGNAVFAAVQFEYTSYDQSGKDTYGMLPSPIAILTLDQEPATASNDAVTMFSWTPTP
jgi:hypothetical protein